VEESHGRDYGKCACAPLKAEVCWDGSPTTQP
jgi:hypothetical protein